MVYAKRTKVPVEQTRVEIERLVAGAGATAFAYASNSEKAQIQFELRERTIRFVLPLPNIRQARAACRGNQKPSNKLDQLVRERWRALKLTIKAKLESIDLKIEQFDEAFLSQIVDPTSGRTVYETINSQIGIAYSENPRPIGLPSPEDVSA